MRTALLVLNIIGFVFSIPAAFCSYMCAGVVAGAAGSSSTVSTLAGMTWGIWFGSLIVFIMAFIAYAKPKTKIAFITGILLILLGVFFIVVGGVTANGLGIVTGIIQIIAGAMAIGAKPPVKATA
jgi:hypothetical protein